MSTWLSEDAGGPATPDAGGRRPTDLSTRAMRMVDIVLAAGLLLLVGLPLLLILRRPGRLSRERLQGRGRRPLERLGLALPGRGLAGLLRAAGAPHWPVLIHILRGQMAWVGPRPRRLHEQVPEQLVDLRPGVVGSWFLRSRTAVDYGSEDQADLADRDRRGLRHDCGLLLRAAFVACLPARLGGPSPARVALADVTFDNVDMDQALQRISSLLDAGQATQVCFVNPACVNIAARHRGYRRLLSRAGLVLPDGIGIRIGTALLGRRLRQNVNGTDLFPRLCDLLQRRSGSIFLLGGMPGIAEQVAAQIAQCWPGLRIAGHHHGFFNVAEEGRIVATVRASGADLLLVARGVPGQDLFIDRYLPQLGVQVAMGVGGLFDFVSGRIARAPLWMRETGLEWIWRLMQEPGRMWRRYLVGNLTFLGRVSLQRAGLRRAATTEAGAPAAPAAPPVQGVRTVLFATTLAAADLPVAPDLPMAFLPYGHQTLIERLLAELARAGVRDIDLVVSDRPDALRALLGDGSRWGLRLTWHLAKDPAHPYAVLDLPRVRGAARLLIGHAECCPDVTALHELQLASQWWMDATHESGPRWSGWGSLRPDQLPPGCSHFNRAMLARHGGDVVPTACLPDDPSRRALGSAVALLQAQPGIARPLSPQDVPASWLRMPWGAMSPLAVVDPQASLEGPVLVGPGCLVAAGAHVGPHVVLSQDVVVRGDTSIDRCLALPGSYIGAGLDLSECIINGGRVRHTRLNADLHLPASDGLMLDLRASRPATSAWAGRLLAAGLLLPIAPVLLVHILQRRLSDQPTAWIRRPVTLGPAVPGGPLQTVSLRLPPPRQGDRGQAWCVLAGVIDVAMGRRHWFGIRPRLAGQWYALRPEWQQILAGQPVGLFHAPAFVEADEHVAESAAAADVYATVQGRSGRARLAWQSLRRMVAGHDTAGVAAGVAR